MVAHPPVNVIYLVCHDLGRHLGCYGMPVASPHLDRFASEGIRFDQAYCSSPCCSPSRVCAMTGLYAQRSGGVGLCHMGWPLPEQVRTVVDHLNDAGVQTMHVGFQHERHPGRNRYQFDREEHWDDHKAARAVDLAIDCLRHHRDGRPFYLNIGTQEVHASLWDKELATYGGPVPLRDVAVPLQSPDLARVRRQLAKFQAAIAYFDAQVGRLLAAIDQLGLRDQTMVVITTDHGLLGHRGKGSLYDHGCEITQLVRLPHGRGAGTVIDHLIPNIDMCPSVLDAMGVGVPAGLDGRSWWPLVTGTGYIPHEAIFIERNFHGEREFSVDPHYIDRYDPVRSIRTRDYHYIRTLDPGVKSREWLPWELEGTPLGDASGSGPDSMFVGTARPRPAEELFHVRLDPLELRDVAGRGAYRHIQADLAHKLEQWMRTRGDPALSGTIPRPYCAPGWGDWPRAR